MRMRVPAILLLLTCAGLPARAQSQTPEEIVQQVVKSAPFTGAAAFIRADQERFVRDLIELTEIPAPPFKEQARAAAFQKLLARDGLSNVEMDTEGNVMGLYPAALASDSPRPILVISAHLDTVFPEGTDVRVKREG